MRKNWQDFVNFLRFIARRFADDRCMQIAGSLTFTTLLALVPLITIALTLFSAFPVFEEFSFQIKSYLLNNLMPEMAGKIITQYMQQFAESAMRLTTVGIVFLGVTAMMLMLTIDHAFNIIWRVNRPRPLFKRLVNSWAVLTLAPLLIGASLSLTSWVVGLSMGYVKNIPVFGVGVLKILPVLFATLAFALLFRLVPNRPVPHAHAWIGALVAAIVFESMNQIFGYFVSNFATYKLVYGAFASVPVFLMWIYLSWLTILVGAVIAASLSHWRVPATKKTIPAARLLDAIGVLRLTAEGLQQGKMWSFPELSRSLHISYDELEPLLGELARAGMVRRAGRQDWLMIRDADHIHVSELLRLFVLDREYFQAYAADDPVRKWLANCTGQLEQNMNITLQELFAKSAA
ncbi:MAG TPA: YihY family inner membrane protein [Gallionella sp.]|nr:YihY family inner membrane protein [Gallionella sp.]